MPLPRYNATLLRWLTRALMLIAAAFVVATVLLLRMSGEEAQVDDLLNNSLPSVEMLMEARAELATIEAASRDAVDATLPDRQADSATALRARGSLEQDVHVYSLTPWYPGELEEFDTSLRPRLRELDEAIARFASAVNEDQRGPRVAADEAVRGAADRTGRALISLAQLNHQQALHAAGGILELRARSIRWATLTGVLATLLAVLAALVSQHASRRYLDLLTENANLMQARAAELEVFGQRLAHDLMSPLQAVATSLAMVQRRDPSPEIVDLVGRATRSLKRSRDIVSGLFDFASSGARPVGTASTELRPAIQAAVDDQVMADPESPPIAVEPFEDCAVACDPGALASILSNLLSNASKHTKESVERRISIRVEAASDRVRVEVEDTGPGVPAGLEDAVFQPYVKAPRTTQPGLGLGLATVRRFAVAYRGAVGLRRGKMGSVFWFELPRAGPS